MMGSRFRESSTWRRITVAALGGASALALAAPAGAQDAPAGAAADEEAPADGVIVVTGTRIAGEAPVGTAIVQLD